MTGRIVLLNGAPRAGKSSIARALQARGDWLALGVDAMMVAIGQRTPTHSTGSPVSRSRAIAAIPSGRL